MSQSLLKMAKDLTTALIRTDRLPRANVHETLTQIFTNLMALQSREVAVSAVPVESSPVSMDWRQSITPHAITCLVCGQTLKQLSFRHLRQHNLDGRSYRASFGIPETQPLAAQATTARRRQVAQAVKPWEKTSRYVKAREKSS
jgi:predicted transcriptional regulator